jgi:hypothetical protein
VKRLSSIAIFVLVFSFPAFSKQDQLPASDKYPLQAHIVSIETEQQQHLTDGAAQIHTRRLMKTEIAGKTYMLALTNSGLEPHALQHRLPLDTGFYPARRTKKGFEVEFRDGDKIRHEELDIVLQE